MNAVAQPGQPPQPLPRRSAGSEFGWGIRLLGRGFGMYAKYPRLMFFGLIPAVIAFVLLVAVYVVLIVFLDDIGTGITSWFAGSWSHGARETVKVLIEIALAVGALWIFVIAYTAVTLLIGDPFYEHISAQIEERLGGAPDLVDLPWYRTLPRSLADSVRMIGLGILIAIPVFAIGLVPVIGQIAGPVLGVILGGLLLTVDLTGIPFNRRGIFLRERRRILRGHRALALGFGVPVALLALVPFANIVVIPAAIAGGTLLTRRVHSQPID